MFKNKLFGYADEDLCRLQLVFEKTLENEDQFSSGLCAWINKVRFKLHEEISLNDVYLAYAYIQINQPFFSKIRVWSDFFWSYGDLEPRMKFIKKHIALIQKERNRRLIKNIVSDETVIYDTDKQ